MTIEPDTCILETAKLIDAREVMEIAHKGQKRWGGAPYSNHPKKVVDILLRMEVYNEDILAAAYLHDTLEDTELDPSVIKSKFGTKVLNLVVELTFQDSSKDDQIYFDQIVKLSNDASIIKIADIYANLTDNKKKAPSTHFIEKRMTALMLINQTLLDYWR